MSPKRTIFGILTMSLLLFGFLLPHRSATAEATEVTVTVQRPAGVAYSPQPGSTADIIATFLFVDSGQTIQQKPPHIAYVYLRTLQVARINSVESSADGSRTYLITFAVDAQNARLLTWISDSRIPLRFVQSEVF